MLEIIESFFSSANKANDAIEIKSTFVYSLVALSWVIGFLGSATTAQILCQAHIARSFARRMWWTALASFTFGFTSIWSLHFIAMLAQQLPVPHSYRPILTLLSAFIAILFTFLALAADLMSRYFKRWRKRRARGYQSVSTKWFFQKLHGPAESPPLGEESREFLLPNEPGENMTFGENVSDAQLRELAEYEDEMPDDEEAAHWKPKPERNNSLVEIFRRRKDDVAPPDIDSEPVSDDENPSTASLSVPFTKKNTDSASSEAESLEGRSHRRETKQTSISFRPPLTQSQRSSDRSVKESSRRSSTSSGMYSGSYASSESGTESTAPSNSVTSGGLGVSREFRRRLKQVKNQKGFWQDASERALSSLTSPIILARSAIWAAGICAMHYMGMLGLRIENGYITWNIGLVILSYLIAFAVCIIATSYMYAMETLLSRQLVFSFIAACGVFSMHYTGQAAATFHSSSPPDPSIGNTMPVAIILAIAATSVGSCLLSNILLAQITASSRDKILEVVLTKRRLWRVLAQKEAAEQANSLKSSFISIASHEIRTPLHTVSGYADLLNRTDLSDEQILYLTNIRRAVHTIQLITRQVLDFSRMERTQAETDAHPVEVDLRDTVQGVAGMPEDRPLEAAHVALMIFVAPDCPQKIYVDEVYLTRILMNLISNALKFTVKGHVLLKVTFVKVTNELLYEVEDTGIGIPKKFQQTLFDPFTQADQSLTRKHTGTGLGLAIAKQLTNRLGGSLDVYSIEREGTTFSLRIPLLSSPEPIENGQSAETAKENADNNAEQQKTNAVRLPEVMLASPEQSDVISIKRQEVTMVFCGEVAQTRRQLAELWRQFGYDVREWSGSEENHVQGQPERKALKDADYVWIDASWAAAHEDRLTEILLQRGENQSTARLKEQPRPIVCFPYNSPEEFSISPLLMTATNLLRLQRPLVFHQVLKQLDNPLPYLNHPAQERLKLVRFASSHEVNGAESESESESRKEKDAFSTALAAAKEAQLLASMTQANGTILPELKSILLVDDNPINQRLGARILQKLSYETSLASNGREAVEMVRSTNRPYDCVLMDIQMPIMNGFEACARIRELEREGVLKEHVPIIALTANVSSESEYECVQKGMDGFLPKPLLIDDLANALKKYMASRPQPGEGR